MKRSKFLIVIVVLLSVLFIAAAKKSNVKPDRYENLEMFTKVLHLIESQYYRKVDSGKLIQGALIGMMNTLDPHSSFLDAEVFEKMQEDTRGEFQGLGIEVTQKDGVIIVITPIDDTPAYEAGILPGDKIVEIDYESTIGLTLEQAVEKMKGEVNTKVTIGIMRDDQDGIKRITIKRKIIKTKSVKSKVIGENIIYIRLTQFQQRAGKDVLNAIKRLSKKIKGKKAKGIILDLRSNPGGLLDEAVNVSSIFLNDGIVVSTEARNKNDKEFRYVKKGPGKVLSTPLAVLINGASASASEIVAGALQDSKRAIIMGSRSFGKGSVQSVSKIDSKRGLKLTIAQYMTPSGKKIQAIGIRPDVELDEIDSPWYDRKLKKIYYTREKDLRNHLTATIETKSERLLRNTIEKDEREKKLKAFKLSNNKKKKKIIKNKPENDYQVIQAMNYLKSFNVFQYLNKK